MILAPLLASANDPHVKVVARSKAVTFTFWYDKDCPLDASSRRQLIRKLNLLPTRESWRVLATDGRCMILVEPFQPKRGSGSFYISMTVERGGCDFTGFDRAFGTFYRQVCSATAQARR